MTWLYVIGIGEDGIDGLSKDACVALENAQLIIGGERHHNLTSQYSAARIAWPSPFHAMVEKIAEHKDKRVCVLVTGDPLWYSAGATIAKAFARDEVEFFPQVSAFQWASSRMSWALANCDTLTIHGRAVEQVVSYIAPNAKLLVLTKDKSSPKAVAELLTARGFGKSKLTVLAHMGGADEQRFDGTANDWAHDVPDFHTLAIECVADKGAQFYGRTGGLPDDAFEHDGQMTKRVVRAATISALRPYQDALLWDIGAGCGSVAIEWMRGARGACAIAIEPNKERLAMMAQNALILGAPKLEQIEGKAPEALIELKTPDAIFVGGGITTENLFETAWNALHAGGRLVANAVTLESEAKLITLQAKYGGTLDRISASEAIEVGRYQAMKPFMSVMQWCVTKPYEVKS